jgi:hypothetical protein
LGILATWCAYIAFALATSWRHFGLTPTWPVDEWRYTLTRISVVTAWLLVATLLLFLHRRAQPLNWRSFIFAFAATVIAFLVFSTYLVVPGANLLAVAGAVGFYGLVSGFACITVGKPKIAAVVGPLLLCLQLLADLSLLVTSGVLRFH